MKKLLLLIASILIMQTTNAWVIQYANPVNASYSTCNDGQLNVQVWGTSTDIFKISVTGPSGVAQLCKSPDNFGSSFFTVNFYGLAAGTWHVEVWRAGPGCIYVLPGEYNDAWRTIGTTNTCTAPIIVNQTSAIGNCNNGSVTLSNGQTISNLPPGPYTYNGSYQCGCASVPFSTSTTIAQTACFTAYTTHTDLTAPGAFGCTNGKLRVDMNGDQNYNVQLNGPTNAVANFNGHVYEFTNLPEGNYSVTIKNMDLADPNCCIVNLSETIGATPCNTSFTPLSTASDLGCNNGKIEFTISQPNSIAYYDITVAGVSNGYWTAHLVTTNSYHLFENVPPGDYDVTVYEHRPGGLSCYCQTTIQVNVGENTCAPVTAISVNPQDDCGPSSVTLSNGDIITQLTPGHHTLTGTNTCHCGTLPYSVDVDIPYPVCNFTVNATVNYVNGCNATISGSVNNTNCGAIVMLWKKNQLSPDPIATTTVGPNGSFNFEYLTNGSYNVQIKSLYSDFYCNTSTPYLKVTGITCLPPANESAAMVTIKKVLLTWDTLDCADGYVIRYKPAGTTIYKTKQILSNVGLVSIGGLLTNTVYDWSIKTLCATGKKSDFSSNYTFCVGNNCMGARLETASDNSENELKLFPNPAKDFLQLSLPDLETDNGQLCITNSMGQIVLLKSLNGESTSEQNINLANFANGIYQLNLITPDHNYTARFVVAR